MAGGEIKLKTESFGNRILWQFISGTGVLRPKEVIKKELTRNTDKFLNGLLFYKRPTAPQGELLKDRKLSSPQKELVQKVSVFLGMDEGQSYDLFCSYLSQDFRGSQKNLQLALSTERHSHALIQKLRDYYYSERLYLLQCIRHVITYWSEHENHAYRREYSGLMDVLFQDDRLIKHLLSQLDTVMDESLPSWETHGPLMSDRATIAWAHQNLQEQHEILETLLVYWKDFEASPAQFIKLLEKFKRQGFGRRQVYKHLLDDSMDRMLKRIGALEVLVLLQAFDMETVERLSQDEKLSTHSLLMDKETFLSVDKTIQLLGSEAPHGPVLLAWAVVRQLYLGTDGGSVTRKLGNLGLQLDVFRFLSEMLDREPFSEATMTGSLSHCVVYTVLLAALTAFDETTLCRNSAEMQVMYDILSKVLTKEFIAGNVWNKGLEQGVGNMFQAAMLNFPLDFTTLVKLSTSLALATSDSASKVLELWSELPRYTESLDRNSSQDIRPTDDRLVWQLARDKLPYTSDEFCISAGVYGQLFTGGRRQGAELDIPVIQWEVAYDGWQLLKCEVQELLHQVSRGAGMVSPVQISRVTDITEFVKAICKSQPQAADGLADIIRLLYTIIQRFTAFTPPPLDLLAASLECVTYSAKLHPKQAWHDMKQTGLLPFLTENVDNMSEVLSGQGLSPGLYGALLAGFESTQGRYPLTLAFLNFLSALVQPLYRARLEKELLPSVMYMLREILPVFQKWRYYTNTRREIIGQKCLDIVHKILIFPKVKDRKVPGKPHLQDVCVYCLLYTEAGRSLLEIIATGVETVEILLAQQSSRSEGSGEDLIQLIQLGFSVMNRLLLLRPSGETMSPVEVALSSQPAGYQNQHIVAVIAEYIYHRTSPLLCKLATLFLKRLAVVLPMSILACLGNQADAIRDIYLMRLQSVTEDLGLKTGILELLSVCVDTQPGLIEVFLNVQTDMFTDKNKGGVSVGGTSCLQTVLDLMDMKRQNSYQCPPDLLCGCTDFVQSLWGGLRETAMAALRSKENFWPSLCEPLFKDLEPSTPSGSSRDKPQALRFTLKTVSHILKILAQEIYTVTSGKLDANLKKILEKLAKDGRLKYWSKYITESVASENAALEEELILEGLSVDVGDHPTLKLLTAWKNLMVVLAKLNVVELRLTDDVKEGIVGDLLGAVHTQFSCTLTPLTHRLSQTCSALLLTLVKHWTSSIGGWEVVLERAHATVSLTASSGDMVIPSVQIGLLGSMTAILQHLRLATTNSVGVPLLRSVLVTVCEVLLQSTRELPSPKELRDRQEGTDRTFVNTDHRIKLQVVTCCLLEELIHHIGTAEVWLPVLQDNIILTALLSSAEIYLKAQEGVQYIQTMFLLFLAIASTDKGAEALSLAGLTQHTCLAVTYSYQNPGDVMYTPTAKQSKAASTATASPVTWHGVYCLCLELYASLLRTLKYSFLEDALNFVGSHQDRLIQCLDMVRFGLYEDAFREAEVTCYFVSQLSEFSREWRLHLPDSLNNILTRLVYMSQTFVSYLIRPRYLQHILEHRGADGGATKRGREARLPPSLQHQTSTEDIDNPSSQLIQVQSSMLKTLGQSLSALRQFSPDLVQILVDQNMDIGEYEPFLSLGFSTPPVDQDTPPTFGCLLSCVSVCLRLLTKTEARSPQRSAGGGGEAGPPGQTVARPLTVYVMENALYLTMSQAMLYLKDPAIAPRDKQLLKRELGTEMNSFLSSMHRYFRRSGPQSPASAPLLSPHSQSPGGAALSRSISQTFTSSQEQAIFRLVQEFSRQILR